MVDAAADDAHGSAAPGGTADAAADAAAAVRPETPPTDDTDLPGMAARDTMDQSDGAGGLAVPSAALYSPTAITRTQVPGSAKLEPPGRPAEVEPQLQDGVAVAQRKMRLEADDAALIPAASRCSGTTATQAYQEAPGGAARTPFERTPSYSALVRPLAQRDWKRDRGSVDLELARLRSLIALAGIMGALLAVIQEELVQTGREPYSTPLNVLKIGNMLCSLCLLALLVRYYMMWELFERIVMHLTALHPLDTRVPTSSVYSSWWFRAEAMFFGVFLPPFCSFELTTTNWDNILVYRAETIFAVINSFRVLLVWPILKNKILVSLPRRHTIAGFSNIKMGNAFAFKVLLNNESFALRFIGCVWALSFLLCAFWFRAAESSACLVISVETNLTMASSPECKKPNARLWSLVSEHGVNATTATDNRFEKINDLYLWNALWAMFVTSTSLGYGDILSTTHFGRVVCLVSALTGLVCAATLTAALSVVLTWTDDEMSAMLMVRREQAKLDLYKHSEGLIRNWMRNYLHKKKRLVNHYGVTVWRPDLKLLRQTFEKKQLFRRAKVATLVSLDDCQADGKKFELIFQATRYVMEAMSEVESKVRELTQEQPHDSPSSPSEFSRKDTNTSMLVPAPLVHADDASFLIRRAIDKAHKHRHTTQPSHKILEREDDIFESATQERKRTEEALEERIAAETADGRPKDIVSLVRQAAEVHRSGTGFDAHKNDWRRSRSALSRRENQSMIAAAVFGLSGTLCAIAQTEWVFLNQDPRALPCTLFKLFNTVLTILCLMSLYRVYSMSIWMTRLHKHLSHGRPFNPVITVSCVLQRWKFLLEVVICILHVPPFSTGESSLPSLDNIIVYRYEVLGCLANLLRIYLLWRPFQRWMISDIPNRNKIAGISGIQFGSLFVIKRMVNSWNSVAYVALAWFVSVIFFGYLLRITEITSCRLAFSENAACLLPSSRTWVIYGNEFEKTNDFMAWNGMWLVFVTMSTVGYGDTVPTTHLGRLVCALATLVGIGLASLITAALANMMKFNSYEEAALAVVRREQSRIKLRETVSLSVRTWVSVYACTRSCVCLCMRVRVYVRARASSWSQLNPGPLQMCQ